MSTTARWDLVHAPHGIASLRHTHWLDDEPRAYDGAPGLWWAADGRVRATDADGLGDVELEPFAHVLAGDIKLRAFARDGALALRVYDPQNLARVGLPRVGYSTHP